MRVQRGIATAVLGCWWLVCWSSFASAADEDGRAGSAREPGSSVAGDDVHPDKQAPVEGADVAGVPAAPVTGQPAPTPANDNAADAAARQQVLNTAIEHFNRARQLLTAGKAAEAEDDAATALALGQQVYGDLDPRLVPVLDVIAQCQVAREAWDEARQTREDILARTIAASGEDNYRVVDARLALEHLARLQTLTADQRRELSEAAAVNSQVVQLYQQARTADAIPLAEQVLTTRRELLGERHPDYPTSLNNLAELYRSQGDYERAEPLYRQALEIRKEVLGERHPHYALSVNNLANLYQSQSDYVRAESLYRQALEINKEVLGERHPEYARSLNNLASLYDSQADYARAEPLLRQALEINKEVFGERHPDYARGLNNLALLLPEVNQAVDGFPWSAQAVEIATSTLEATAAVQSERQQLAMADSLAAYMNGMLSLAQLAGVEASATYPAPFRSKGQVFVRQQAIRQLRESADQSPDSKEAQAFAQLSDRARVLDQLAKLTPEPEAAAEHQQRLEDLTLEIEQLQRTLSSLSAEFRQAQQATVVTPDDVAARLPADAALVDLRQYGQYLPHDAEHAAGRWERQYVAFITRRETPPQVVWLGPAEPINAAVALWHEHVGAGPSATAGHELLELVWEKLEPQLHGVTTVLISPDGPLNQFPWGALPGRETGAYLIEEYAFVTVPVPLLLPALLDQMRDPSAQPTLLAVGDVNYGADPGVMQLASRDRSATAARGESGIEKWGPLAETRVEVAAIEDTHEEFFPDAGRARLRRDKATEQEFRTAVPQASVLHIATHGYFAPESLRSLLSNTRDTERSTSLFQQQDVSGWHPGLLSGIVLAGANNEPQPDRDDGVLTALEVAELDLSNADLVTLSACETGLGKSAGGEGVLGLQRAFQLAGARTTVTSLWKVRDDATRSLMVRFYENLWKHNMTRVEALWQAQLATLRDNSLRGADPVGDGEANDRLPPRYWAAFVLSGDWR